ncbi:protein RD3-like isoform X2 [Dunckerocampus dactyliophorus]|nr:protein RD3-like isoform X2 [Dunckerocampus dactyliophorus]
MPLFSWPEGFHGKPSQSEIQSWRISGDRPSHVLLQELLWHVQEGECTARTLEREHRLAHDAVDHQCFHRCPRLRSVISTSELHQLELLCASIPTVHAAAVLSRFHEVLAGNKVMPWELVSVFRLVLKDFFSQRKRDEEDNPLWFWTSRTKLKKGAAPRSSSYGDKQREEIPTVSGYVDRAMWCTSWLTAKRDRELPYYYPVAVSQTEACYSSLRGNSFE